jgi:exosortase
VGLCVFYYPLIASLPSLWLNDDHYSHGFLIPIFAGYVIYKWWPDLCKIPVRPGYVGIPFLAASLFVGWAALRVEQSQLMSLTFVLSLICLLWVLLGGRWAAAVSLPVLFLLFMLPVWLSIIDVWTLPLQLMSTQGAFHILAVLGQSPRMDPMDPTAIDLSHYQFTVAVVCSGMKLVLAVFALTGFFLMISKLKWWSQLAMVAVVLPLCLLTNSLRIAMVGLVGNTWGDEAGHQFHDWSGYISLIFCFFVLFRFARLVGWKD